MQKKTRTYQSYRKVIVCKDCLGDGYYTVDYHDPSNDYGHGQRVEQCEACQGTGLTHNDYE